MVSSRLELNPVLDGLGQGVLIFNSKGQLVIENLAARNLLGQDLTRIRNNGWDAAATLFNTQRTNPDDMLEAIRDKALESGRPVRFQTMLAGEVVPCWAAAVLAENGEICIMLTLDMPDWSVMTNLIERFRREMQDAIDSTQGHIDLIGQTIAHHKDEDNAETLSKRIGGFTRLISIHMDRVGRLMELMERLEAVRTGALREHVRARRRKVDLTNFLEDFTEELDEIRLIDPETEATDVRSRLEVNAPDDLAVTAVPSLLTVVLRDLLRNAIMYSIKATPVRLNVKVQNGNVQFDLVDEGYGIRERERERVFAAFQRARQPQIIAEFGYGLSLYLCKHEVEAMNGRMWFESEENVGTTVSFMLPVWGSSSVSDSD